MLFGAVIVFINPFSPLLHDHVGGKLSYNISPLIIPLKYE